jgi:formate hydrogenlyase subunit 3/multisubunit Na+/H+ antiporter MnhD subunit
MTIVPVLGAIALPAASGLAAVALRRRPAAGQAVACATLCAGAALGLVAAAAALAGGEISAPGLGLRVDALSAVFLAPICAVCALGAIYGLGYFPQAALGARAVRLQLYYGLVTAGMVLLVAASNAIAFLVGWEVMALSAFLLVHTDHERAEVQRAAFVYLAATHVGTIALFALFALLRQTAGSFEFAAMQGLSGAGPRASFAFALALVGFGLKAGLMPLHFWLPGAHAATPSHISAVMSGVLIKTGIYGLLRVTGFFDAPPAAWGTALLLLGGASAVLGVAFALAQHDLKRLLAYHSVENIGIIALGAGLALLGRARNEPALVMLGLGGAALHVVNHALFKSLLFLGAGAVQHATGTRELDLLGGLARPMRATAILFLVGAAAICGLPPLNGFVSEWLVYLGFLAAMERGGHELFAFAVLGVPVLALVGGLAAGCFAKVVGVVFLGSPRSAHARAAHEAPRTMLAPMAILAGACIAIGLAPAAVLPALVRAAQAWSRLDPGLLAPPAARASAGAWRVSAVAAVLLLAAGGVALLRRRLRAPRAAALRRAQGERLVETWSCGFVAPTARMQYTGSSFAELLVRRFSWAIFPRASVPRLEGPFPAEARFHTVVPDTVLDLGLAPAARGFRWLATRAHLLYLRRIQFQVLLLLATLVAALAWGFVW